MAIKRDPSGVQTTSTTRSGLPETTGPPADGSSKMRRGGTVPASGATHTDSGWLSFCGATGVVAFMGHRLAVTAEDDPGVT